MAAGGDDLDSTAIHGQVTIFNTFALLGVCLIVAVLAPALFLSRVRRSGVWFCVLTSWLVYSVSFLLLIGQQTGPEPPFGVCFLQAALIYATPPLCSAAYTCFAIEYYLKVSSVVLQAKQIDRRVSKFLPVIPWVVFVGVYLEVMLVVQKPSMVERDSSHFYCHVTSSIPPITTAVVVLVAGGILVPLQIYTALLLYRNWGAFRRLSASRGGISLSVFVRLGLFTLTGGIGLGLSLFIVPRIKDSVARWSILLPMLPVVAAICFGTQWDILNAWMFWRKSPPIARLPRTPVNGDASSSIVKGSLMTIDSDDIKGDRRVGMPP